MRVNLIKFLLIFALSINAYGSIPAKAKPYIKYLLLSDNPSRHAAQMEQESGFRVFAKSPYAKGIAQFTDSTGKWAANSFCRDLGKYQPYNPAWSIKCSIRYMSKLQGNNHYGEYCLNRKIGEQEYNGGAWVIWEIQAAGSHESAKLICGRVRLKNGRKRAGWACKENYQYPVYISKRQPKYKQLGGQLCT